MRTLVTGGAGYIGSHVCKALALAGHQPIVFDNLVHGHADAVKWGPLVEGDILDNAALDRVMREYRPDLVMHFAAFAYVGESVDQPSKYYGNNVGGSLSLLEAMRRNDVESIIFSSTCATYGVPDELPINETTPQRPINPYGFTKVAVERALADYGAAYGLKWVAMRYFNAAGADPAGDIGERHDPETHAIPLAIKAAFGTAARFGVFGADYPTPDGSALRDYIHVSDLASAHVAAIDYLCAGGESTAINLATERPVSVFEILRAVREATGRAAPFDVMPRRSGDPPTLYARADKARRLLNFEPRHTSIGEIVDSAARWFAHA